MGYLIQKCIVVVYHSEKWILYTTELLRLYGSHKKGQTILGPRNYFFFQCQPTFFNFYFDFYSLFNLVFFSRFFQIFLIFFSILFNSFSIPWRLHFGFLRFFFNFMANSLFELWSQNLVRASLWSWHQNSNCSKAKLL